MRELFGHVYWRNHIFALIQLSLSLLLLVAATVYYFDKNSALENANNQYSSAMISKAQASEQRNILQASLMTYRQRQKRGDIGEPRRLQWLEALRRVDERYQIQSMEFILEGSELVQENIDHYWNAEVPIRATNMKLLLKLSHEGDLYRIIEGLRAEAEGLFSVENCKIRWLETYSDEIALTRLRGECQLRWYTLMDVTSNWPVESP